MKDQILNSFSAGGHLGFAESADGDGRHLRLEHRSERLHNENPRHRKKVIRKLIDIAKDPREAMARRKRAIGWLSRSNDSDVQKFLEELLRQ